MEGGWEAGRSRRVRRGREGGAYGGEWKRKAGRDQREGQRR